MIPLYHDFRDETVLVFGGGAVGARKARRFAAEAMVVVVSPSFDPDLHALATNGRTGARPDGDTESTAGPEPGAQPAAPEPGASTGTVELVRGRPRVDCVGDWIDRTAPALVVAATDDAAVNAAAEAATRERGRLVNRTDESGARDAGSVVVPATVEDGPVTVAVSTGGRSPALSRYLRQGIEREIAGAGAMADLTAGIRADLKARDVDPEDRRAAVRAVVRSTPVWKALQGEDANARKVADRVVSDTCDT